MFCFALLLPFLFVFFLRYTVGESGTGPAPVLYYYYYYHYYYYYCEVGATERGCSGSIGSDDTRGYGAGSGDVGKELPRGMIP